MNTNTKECHGGFVIETSPYNEIILSATSTRGNKISLNDYVSSSGRVFCPAGTMGRVVEIAEPFKGITTDHIFLVDFEEYGLYYMGFQDLEFRNGTYAIQNVPEVELVR